VVHNILMLYYKQGKYLSYVLGLLEWPHSGGIAEFSVLAIAGLENDRLKNAGLEFGRVEIGREDNDGHWQRHIQ